MLTLFDPRVAWSKPVVGLGALTTLVALGFEPVIQQIITLPIRLSLRAMRIPRAFELLGL